MNCHRVHPGRERGQAILLVIVGLSVLLIGALGLALDGAQMYAQQQMARGAADGAASNNATLTGANVSFYDTFDGSHPYRPIIFSNNVVATLSATSSGSLKGILFFEDRNAPAGFTHAFDNNSSQSVTGVLYFPRSAVSLSNNGSLGHLNMAIVANTVQVSNNASLKIGLDLSESGAPQKLGVALVN